MRMNFTNNNVNEIFAVRPYDEFQKLMFEAADENNLKVSKEDANKKIRQIMFEVLGIDEKANRSELRKAIRRHRVDVYEVIEETVEKLLVTGWGENPFFREFVEIKNMQDGDTNEFYVPDEVVLTVAEVSGNHHDLIRQKLAEGTTFSVKTGWYGVKFSSQVQRCA